MIKTLDCNFLGESESIGAFLMETEEGPILFETGPHSTFPTLVKAIKEHGYEKEDIKHVFLTHIHFDHAGAAWAFAEHGAKIYLHPRGVKHMADPSRLYESAKRIYQDKMDTLWGKLNPIPMEQMISPEDNERIKIGKTKIRALYTPGHATHHIAWEIGNILIAGDVCGCKIDGGPVVPPCPPPDINLEDWSASIRRIKLKRYEAVYLTHFGRIENVKEHLKELEGCLKNWANWIRPHYENDRPQVEVVPDFLEYVNKQMQAAGCSDALIKKYEGANPPWMSVAGLYRYWYKKQA